MLIPTYFYPPSRTPIFCVLFNPFHYPYFIEIQCTPTQIHSKKRTQNNFSKKAKNEKIDRKIFGRCWVRVDECVRAEVEWESTATQYVYNFVCDEWVYYFFSKHKNLMDRYFIPVPAIQHETNILPLFVSIHSHLHVHLLRFNSFSMPCHSLSSVFLSISLRFHTPKKEHPTSSFSFSFLRIPPFSHYFTFPSSYSTTVEVYSRRTKRKRWW